jgi:predicted nucleic acid-binding protein
MGHTAERIDRPVVLDNTVLTNLAVVDRADLVKRLWPKTACTTSAILDEYRAGAVSGLVPADAWVDLAVVTMSEEETALMASVSTRLAAGERSCLAVAVCRDGLLASDDLDARRIARKQNVALTGTVGILGLCVRRGCLLREEANGLLTEMIAVGYHSPVDSMDQLVEDS